MPLRRHRASRRPLVEAVGLCVVLAPLLAALVAGPARADVALRAPAEGSTASGTVAFALTGSRRIIRATFVVAGGRRDVDTAAPFRYGRTGRLNTRRLREGPHRLTIMATTRSGRHLRFSRRIRVSNAQAGVAVDRTPPRLEWLSPAAGQVVSGHLHDGACAVSAKDRSAVARVEFFVDAAPLNLDTTASYSCVWDTTFAVPGRHTLKAVAYDVAGNRSTGSVDVIVDNLPGPISPTPPAPTPTPTPTPTDPAPPDAPAAPPASGVFVAPTGSDATGAGTVDHPYHTLEKAAAAVPPGQTVYMRGGVYTGKTMISRVGTSAAPIAFKPYPGEAVVLDGSGVAMGSNESLVTIWKSAYVTFDGFEICNTQGRGLSALDGDHIAVINNTVHDTRMHPIMGSGDYLTFDGNHIYRGVMSNVGGSTTGGWPGGLSTWLKSDGSRSTHVKFLANHVHDTWGEGIIALYADDVTVADNTVHDVWSVSIYVDDAARVKVERNFVYRTSSAYYRYGSPAQGIMLANEYYSSTTVQTPINDVLIANNVVVGTSHAVAFWIDTRRTVGNTYSGVRVYNNVFKDTTGTALWFQDVPAAQPQPTGNVARNNIIFRGADGGTLDIGDMSGWSFSNNAFPNGIPAGQQPSSLAQDPLLVNPVASAGTAGFKVRLGSPVIGAGAPIAEVVTDLWGMPHRSQPTLGVHEG